MVMTMVMMMTMMILDNDNEEDAISVDLVGMVSSGDIKVLVYWKTCYIVGRRGVSCSAEKRSLFAA